MKLLYTALLGVIAALLLVFWLNSEPTVTSTVQGEPLRLEIQARSVSDLAGIQTDVVYNPSVVRFERLEEGPFLDAGNKDAAILLDMTDASKPGDVKNIVLLRLQPAGVTGSGTIATVYFTKTGSGDHGIRLQNVLLSDSNENELDSSLVTGLVIAE